MDEIDAELQRTAFQKKAVSRLSPDEVLDMAVAFFAERGYRAGRTGRPGQVFVMGKAEGALPRVTGEVSARADIGKAGTTLVTMDSEQRLATILLRLARKLGKRQGEYLCIVERISQEELAWMVGTTRSRVGYFLKRFHDAGFVRRTRESYLLVHEELLTGYVQKLM